ncbi:MAG: PHP domain-containing protein, partial [Erysipelotrichaceae bacterium]|nr:PHP domain-containing protein [Erysipelotrichaceae bacterium]
MNFNISDVIAKYGYSEEKAACLSRFHIADVLFRKSTGLIIIKAENESLLPYGIYCDLLAYFRECGLDNVKLYLKAERQDLPLREIGLYLDEFRSVNPFFRNCVPLCGEDGFLLSYAEEDDYQKDLPRLDDLKLYFYDLGYRKGISMEVKKEEAEAIEIETKEVPPAPVVKKPEENRFKPEKPYYKAKSREYTEVKIDDLVEQMNNIKFTGEMFKIEERVTRNTGSIIQTIYVKDEDNAVIVKCVESKRFTKEVLRENKEGKCAVFYGNYRFDTFMNDYLFEPDQIEFIEKENDLIDEEPEKRVELHMHTKLSEMDGVSSPSECVKAAYAMGHRAVAITDHLCLQGFHEAYGAYKGIMKKAGEDKPD